MLDTAKDTYESYISDGPFSSWGDIAALKQQFISTGRLSGGTVPNFVRDMWQRSVALGVDPDAKFKQCELSLTEVEKDLLKAIVEVFNGHYFKMVMVAVCLYNTDGVLIYRDAMSQGRQDMLDSMGMHIGSDMSEKAIGSSAHSIALKTGKVAHVLGPHNYHNVFNECILVAAPVVFQNKLLGAIEIVVLEESFIQAGETGRRMNFLTSILLATKSVLSIKYEQTESDLIKSTINANMHKVDSLSGLITVDKEFNIRYLCNLSKSLLRYDNSINLQYYISNIHEILADVVQKTSKYKRKYTLVLDNGDHLEAYISVLKNEFTGETIGYSLVVSMPRSMKYTRYSLDHIIGEHKSLIALKDKIGDIAQTRHNILILGGSGTGKEMVAQAIHDASGLKGPFVAINCASIPANLIESELFGYVEGAFTGATKTGSIGKVEYANNGTLFLDEIGDMPLALQPVLLRMLEERQIMRIGAKEPTPVNVRVIAATNVKLYKKVKAKEFREDLYFRLSVINLEVPLLKDRGNDILILAKHFLEKELIASRECVVISDEAQDILLNYDWPGNIRQLENAMISAIYALGNESVITSKHLPPLVNTSIASSEVVEHAEELSEKELMLKALDLCNWHMAKTAEKLKISRTKLYYKLRFYGIDKSKRVRL